MDKIAGKRFTVRARVIVNATGVWADRIRQMDDPGLPYIWAQVPYAIQHEMASTLSDVLIRRTHIIHEDREQGSRCASSVAALMAQYLGWEPAEVERQIEHYHQQIDLSRAFQREALIPATGDG